MRFSSKVDGWLVPVLLLAFAGLVAALIVVLIEPTPWPVRILTALMVVLVTALLFSMFRNTWYEVGKTELRIVCGLFKWKIAIEDIADIRPTRNPLSAPALSLDRLKISYGKRKFMLVSPSDKEGFISAVEQARQGILGASREQEKKQE
jgi:uncharacterized protein (DUF58 family)